jgi:hypothetical protein
LFVLFARGRLTAASAGLPASDLVLAGLFVWAFDALGCQNAAESRLKRSKFGQQTSFYWRRPNWFAGVLLYFHFSRMLF